MASGWLAGLLVAGLVGCGGRSEKGATGGSSAAGGGATGEGTGGGAFASSGSGAVAATSGTFSSGAVGHFGGEGGQQAGGGLAGSTVSMSGNGSAGGAIQTTGCGVTFLNAPPLGTPWVRVVDVAGLDPVYLPGGAFYQSAGSYDFSHRPYAARLPPDYDYQTRLRIHVSAGGCGEDAATFAKSPPSPTIFDPHDNSIEVVLSYIDGCVADGGPKIGNRTDTPDLPYLRAVLVDVQATFCADVRQITLTGYASGAWEAQTLACAAGGLLHGVATLGGGLRVARPACSGRVPSFFVTRTNDIGAPIGPLLPSDPTYVRLGSPGLAPSRDEVLARNGCQGDTTAPWNPNYPACLEYTGCPAAFPVVWCEIGPTGQTLDYFNGVQYFKNDLSLFFSSLP